MVDISESNASPASSSGLLFESESEPASHSHDNSSEYHPDPAADDADVNLDVTVDDRQDRVNDEQMEFEDTDDIKMNDVPDVTAADINSTSELVNVLSFCQVFAPILMLPPFSFLELEQAIIFSHDDPLYAEIVARCIYLGQNRKDALKPDQWQTLSQRIISSMKDSFVGFMHPESNESKAYQSLLDKTVAKSEPDSDLRPSKRKNQNSLILQWTDTCHSLSPYARLLILSNLCDWACSESLEILRFIATVDPDQFRPEPQGRSSEGNLFWFFHSSVQSQCGRLYEQFNQGQVRLVAQTLNEIICFVSDRDDGSDPALAPFFQFLREEIIPNETIKAEAEQRKAQRLRRQGLVSESVFSSYSESRRSSMRPTRFAHHEPKPEEEVESRGIRRSSRRT